MFLSVPNLPGAFHNHKPNEKRGQLFQPIPFHRHSIDIRLASEPDCITVQSCAAHLAVHSHRTRFVLYNVKELRNDLATMATQKLTQMHSCICKQRLSTHTPLGVPTWIIWTGCRSKFNSALSEQREYEYNEMYTRLTGLPACIIYRYIRMRV